MTLHFTGFGAIQGEKADEVANNTLEGGVGEKRDLLNSTNFHHLQKRSSLRPGQFPFSTGLFHSRKIFPKREQSIFPRSLWIIYTQR